MLDAFRKLYSTAGCQHPVISGTPSQSRDESGSLAHATFLPNTDRDVPAGSHKTRHAAAGGQPADEDGIIDVTPHAARFGHGNAPTGPRTKTWSEPNPAVLPGLRLVAPPERRQRDFVEGLAAIAVDCAGVDRPVALHPLATHLHDRFTAGLLARELACARMVGARPA